jgi:hypothetical protein
LSASNYTNLGAEILDHYNLLSGVLTSINHAGIWALPRTATSVPNLVSRPFQNSFSAGDCFWNRHIEYAMDRKLPIGHDGAPAAGGMACDKERFHIVLKVFDSFLITATTATHQGKFIEDVNHIPEKEWCYLEVVDSQNEKRHVWKPTAHAPLLVDTSSSGSRVTDRVIVNAAFASQSVPPKIGGPQAS